MASSRPLQPEQWRAALDALPTPTAEHPRLPAFFFAHGSPALVAPKPVSPWMLERLGKDAVNGGRQSRFLRDFGDTLLKKYTPKAILIFSAHWDSDDTVLVSDWAPRNPILYDFYGFEPHYYSLDFHSHGDATLSRQIVDVLKESGIDARLLGRNETRGMDGKTGRDGSGLDHGVFVPFLHMFEEHKDDFKIPVVQVSIFGGQYSPAQERSLGAAVRRLRDEGVLILSGGLTYHNLRDMVGFDVTEAPPAMQAWHEAILDAIEKPTSPQERHKMLADLERHPGFRAAHPRADHFAPLWVADGAGSEDAAGSGAVLLSALYGAPTIAFL